MSERVPEQGGLDGARYRELLQSASTERQTIVVRLAGEAGLRPTEIAGLAMTDVESRDREGVTHYVARPGGDDGGRPAYLPADLAEALRAHVESTGREPDEPIVGVSPRRIQMIVREVVDRAAVELDEPALEDVSTRDLRRYHARCLLDRGVNPRVVRKVTAWNRLEPLVESFSEPDEDTVVDALYGAVPGSLHEAPPGVGGSPAGDVERRLVDLVERVVDLGVVLSNASTRRAIEREACETLATLYDYAWTASDVGDGTFEFRERSLGDVADALDGLNAPPGTVCREVYETGSPSIETAERLTDERAGGPTVRAVVPIRHADTTYGVLEVGVRAERGPIADREELLLSDLGRRLGQAITAVERQRLLLADTVLRLSFSYTDREAVFVRLSAAFDCSLSLTGLVPGENGSLLAYVWLEGASPEDVFRRATDAESVDSARLIRSGDDGSLLEFVLTGNSPALTLVETGGSLTELEATEGRGTVTAEFVPDVDVRAVVESVEAAFPDSEMVTKREVQRSVRTDTEFEQALDGTLTDKQRSALQAAYLSGYFDWPRGSTAEELADSLGITSPTFHSHLRRAQRKLLATFLEDGDP